ncbi:MAG: flagellar hook-basal body protein [Oscillospiraceae bacterium]|nr:flagellar hook-basal body protein [Oscillospiraceae bacterium]
MNRGYYYAANGMILNQRKMDCIGNNLANVSTAGYKRDTILTNTFDEQMILVKHRSKLSGVFTHRYVDTSYTDLDQSNFEFTDSPFDVAVWGDVYFNVRTNYPGADSEIMLTRNGQWELDDQGYLCLGHSGRIQGENGDIYLGDKEFVIDTDGRIYRDHIGGEYIDRLRVSYINPDADVKKFGANMFTEVQASDPPEDLRYDILQGTIERSNVDWNYELNMLMQTYRMYEANSQILKICDSLNQGATGLCKKV